MFAHAAGFCRKTANENVNDSVRWVLQKGGAHYFFLRTDLRFIAYAFCSKAGKEGEERKGGGREEERRNRGRREDEERRKRYTTLFRLPGP